MGKVKKFEVTMGKQIYYPGEQVEGKCLLELTDRLKVSDVLLELKGKAHTQWEEGGGKDRRRYTGNETYIKEKKKLLAREPGNKGDVVLAPGQHEYPFQFKLPKQCPFSYESQHGYVRYCLKGTLDIPWAIDDHTKKVFTVANIFDLNENSDWAKRGEKQGQKTLCCLCCKSDPIEITARVERVGYVPGEHISFSADIENKSNRKMSKTTACLVQAITYYSTTHQKTFKHQLQKWEQGEIGPRGSGQYSRKTFHIPCVPPSFLLGCNIIDIRYYVEITADPAGPGFDLVVPVEVVIGTVPLTEVARQYGIDPSQPHDTPQNISDNFCQPSSSTFTTSVLGNKANIKDDDDNNGTMHSSLDFSPVYKYYNWNKQDPTRLFTVEDKKKNDYLAFFF